MTSEELFNHNLDLSVVGLTGLVIKNTIDAEIQIYPCGSYFLVDPPVSDTDIDFLVYSESNLGPMLKAQGYVEQEETGPNSSRPTWGAEDPDHRFNSYRKGLFNLIVTQSWEFASRHRAAGSLVKRFNLLDKEDRIAVYQACLYGITK